MADESSLGKAGILNLNALSYRMPPDLSVAVSRTVTSQWFANQTAAAGSSSMCIWNTGAAYVNARQSSLVFDLKNDSAKAVWFGLHGSSAASAPDGSSSAPDQSRSLRRSTVRTSSPPSRHCTRTIAHGAIRALVPPWAWSQESPTWPGHLGRSSAS